MSRMGDDRRAMYDGWRKNGAHSDEWAAIATVFVNHAFARATGSFIKCPCSKCRNYRYRAQFDVELHLCKFGFMPNYLTWYEHGEVEPVIESDHEEDEDRMDEMLDDLNRTFQVNSEEDRPGLDVQEFFRLLDASGEKLHESTTMTVLQFVTWLMTIKSKYNFLNNYYNDFVQLVSDALLRPHKVPKDMY